jgi:hypothetical protein
MTFQRLPMVSDAQPLGGLSSSNNSGLNWNIHRNCSNILPTPSNARNQPSQRWVSYSHTLKGISAARYWAGAASPNGANGRHSVGNGKRAAASRFTAWRFEVIR